MVSQRSKNDELSWQDLRQHALWWLRIFYRFGRFATTFWRRHFRLTFLSMGGFAALLIGLLFLQSQEYRMTTTFVYGDLHPKIFGDMVDKLNALIQNGETEQVARLLNLSPAEAEKIKGIVVSDSRGKPLSTNYTMRKEPMIVTVNLTDTMPADSLRQAVSFYLNENPFTAERLQLKKRLLREELTYIKVKLQTIDSILTNLYAQPGRAGQEDRGITIESGEGKNAYELLSFSKELLQRKSEIENALIHPENVFAIDNFLILPAARFEAAAIVKKGVLGLVAGFLFAALIVFWKEKLHHAVVES